MKTKQTSKVQYLLLIVVLLLNPILVSADALFLNINTADKNNSSVISSMGSDAEMQEGCHDQSMISSQQETDKNAECCEIPCECGASGCNAISMTVNSNKSPFVISTNSLNYLRNHYLSFLSSPGSPPPIV